MKFRIVGPCTWSGAWAAAALKGTPSMDIWKNLKIFYIDLLPIRKDDNSIM